MKFYLPLFIVLSLLLTPLYPVYAESNGFSAVPAGAPAPKMSTMEQRPAPGSVKVVAQTTTRPASPSARPLPLPSFKPLTREEVASKEAMLKQKLAAFRDKTKATRVERISTNLNQINQNRTTDLSTKLDRLSGVLSKLSTILSSDATVGRDTASAEAAIATATVSIQTAKDAVTTQKQANYTLTVNSETTVKTSAMADKNSLSTALSVLQNLMITAHKDTQTALMLTMTAMKGEPQIGQ